MKQLEWFLIRHCSPTLASLKMANLFSYAYISEEELSESIRYWNSEMNKKGIYLVVLKKGEQRALIYVFRLASLQKVLSDPQTVDFLADYGYQRGSLADTLRWLILRLDECEEFPHEIGIFLGYPLEDVIGFIVNKGRNFVYLGFWKVYGDKEEARKKFYRYRKCTDIYTRLWENGRSVWQLTVAA